MPEMLRPLAALLVLCMSAAGCGGSSPSSPSVTTSTATTTPATTPTTPAPAPPETLALTGTWLIGTVPQFFITQTGTTITGTQIFAPITSTGVLITQSGTVSGTMSGTTVGATVTLSLPTTIITIGTGALAGTSITCRTTNTWVGQATNSQMVGTFTAGKFDCDGAGGFIDTKVSGTQIYTKQ